MLHPDLFLVAEASDEHGVNRILGAVIGAWDGRLGWIYHLAVLPNARRGHLGTLLMRKVEERLHARGAIKVNLLVEPENFHAASFYRSLGYNEAPFVFFTKELQTQGGWITQRSF
jgi:ribosomal protein S18 acetylase RimI-like enzyme